MLERGAHGEGRPPGWSDDRQDAAVQNAGPEPPQQDGKKAADQQWHEHPQEQVEESAAS